GHPRRGGGAGRDGTVPGRAVHRTRRSVPGSGDPAGRGVHTGSRPPTCADGHRPHRAQDLLVLLSFSLQRTTEEQVVWTERRDRSETSRGVPDRLGSRSGPECRTPVAGSTV
ncbi:MAG: hypothetical protein AVDCRST_MAG54-499, partial [uncultured Actinomycetospora sp.]